MDKGKKVNAPYVSPYKRQESTISKEHTFKCDHMDEYERLAKKIHFMDNRLKEIELAMLEIDEEDSHTASSQDLDSN